MPKSIMLLTLILTSNLLAAQSDQNASNYYNMTTSNDSVHFIMPGADVHFSKKKFDSTMIHFISKFQKELNNPDHKAKVKSNLSKANNKMTKMLDIFIEDSISKKNLQKQLNETFAPNQLDSVMYKLNSILNQLDKELKSTRK